MVLKTTLGDLDIELWPKEAPKATRNFVQVRLRVAHCCAALAAALLLSCTAVETIHPSTCGSAAARHHALPIPLPLPRTPCQLCTEGYYDGTIFHRMIKDFMVQGEARGGLASRKKGCGAWGDAWPGRGRVNCLFREWWT